MTPSESLKARILAEARSQRAPSRREAARRSSAIVAVSVVACLAIFIARGGIRPTHRDLELMLGTALSSASVASLGLWAGFGRGRSMTGRPRSVLFAVVIGVPLALFAYKVLWSAGFPGGLDEWRSRAGFKCLGVGLSTGIPLLLALLYLRRDSDPTHPVLAGAAVGIGVGAWAATLVDLWCPVGYVPHLLLGHILPMVLLGGIGAILGWRVTAVQLDEDRR